MPQAVTLDVPAELIKDSGWGRPPATARRWLGMKHKTIYIYMGVYE